MSDFDTIASNHIKATVESRFGYEDLAQFRRRITKSGGDIPNTTLMI